MMDDLTEKQINRYKIYLQKNNPKEVNNLIIKKFGKPFETLTRNEATKALSLLFRNFAPKPWLYEGISQSQYYYE
jgi:hypothetical protein